MNFFTNSGINFCLEAAAGGGVGAGEPGSNLTPEEELLSQAVILLSCTSYRNQGLHVFLRPALLASAIHAASSNQKRMIAPQQFNCSLDVYI